MTDRLTLAVFSSDIIREKELGQTTTLLVPIFLMRVKQQNEVQRSVK